MLADLIDRLGTRRIARELEVTPGAVHYWKTINRLPYRNCRGQSVRRYETRLARMAGISVEELRRQCTPVTPPRAA